MSFSEKFSRWFHNTIIVPITGGAPTLAGNAQSSTLNTVQSSVAGAGGGLGNALLSIPGVGSTFAAGLNAVSTGTSNLASAAESLTPSQIAAQNDAAAAALLKTQTDAAAAKGITLQEYQDQQAADAAAIPPYTINDFFNTIFTTTLYLCLFILIMALGLVGSSLAANAAINRPVAFRVYYMIYGFILFPISIGMGIYNYYQKKQLFYAIWAPLHETFSTNKYLNVLLFPFVYRKPGTGLAHFSSSLVTKHPGHHHLKEIPLPTTFEPTAV